MQGDEGRTASVGDPIFAEQPWYAVRCVFWTGSRPDREPAELGRRVRAYEERITIWRARSFGEAISRAENEAHEYAAGLADAEYAGFAQAYHMFSDPTDGAEVFSLIRESSLDPHDYLDRYFDDGHETQQSAE